MIDVRKIRCAGKVSQVELSLLTGISRPRLSAAECGYLTLSDEEQIAIEEAVAQVIQRRSSEFQVAISGRQALAI